jgi:hypothetical protein
MARHNELDLTALAGDSPPYIFWRALSQPEVISLRLAKSVHGPLFQNWHSIH